MTHSWFRSDSRSARRATRADRSLRRPPRRLESLEPRQLLVSDVAISEFVASNSSGLTDQDGDRSDWIELRNTTGAAIDLAGWFLTDDAAELNQWQFPATVIPAQGYLVVFASGKDRRVPGAQLHTDFKLNGDGEYLALVRPGGTVVADDYSPEFPQQYADISYGWSDDLTTRGYFVPATPGTANLGSPIGDPTRQVIFSEIMYHPSTDSDAEEYLELFNKGVLSVNLSGWKITSGVDFTFPAGTTLGVGQRLVVTSNPATFNFKYPAVTNEITTIGWTGSLSNSGEAIVLSDETGETIDRVEYADEGDWATRGRVTDGGFPSWEWIANHDGLGSSLELINPALTNNSGQNWRASSVTNGTPGAANSVSQTNSAPLVGAVEHSPTVPHSSDQVKVTAEITDELTTGLSIQVWYRVSGGESFQALAMFDDGTHGDARAGNGKFTALLPAQVNGTVVEYYVEARDAVGNARTWPAPTQANGQAINALYRVDDSIDASAPWAPTGQPIYQLIFNQAEYAQLTSQSRNTNAQVNATFVSLDGAGVEVRHQVGVRFRGNSSRGSNPPPFRVEFPEDARLHGDDNLNLNPRFSWAQLAGSTVFQLAGLPAAEALPVRVLINGGSVPGWGTPAGGLYVAVEPIDGDFADNHFPDDSGGNLYKKISIAGETHWDYNFGDVGAYLNDGWSKSTNGSANDWSDLDELMRVMNDTSSPDYFANVNATVNLDQWLRWFALMQLLDSRETNLSNGRDDDYQLYSGVVDGRFQLIPHDLDTILGQGDTAGDPTDTDGDPADGIFQPYDGQLNGNYVMPDLQPFFEHPEIATRYYATLRELCTTVFLPERIGPALDQALGNYVAAATINAMKQFAEARRQYVLGLIPEALTAVDDLSVQNGYPRTSSGVVALTGTADRAEVRSVTVNGVQTAWDSFDGAWQVGSAGVPITVTLANRNSSWRYLDTVTSDPGTAWRNPGFNDSAWPVGTAVFGAQNEGVVTTINLGSFGNRRITSYYRRTFTASNVTRFTGLGLDLLRDDGAVVYLNGTEIYRDNMPEGAVSYFTRPPDGVGSGAETTYFHYDIALSSLPPGVLVEGTNLLAVELHQVSGNGSNDASFDLGLFGTIPGGGGTGVPLLPGINRLQVEAHSGTGGTGELVESTTRDIWYDDGSVVTVGGVLPSGTTTWTALDGPYQVSSNLTVPAGSLLVIQPGTTVFFDAGVGLTINGTLQAVGTAAQHIRLTRTPAAGSPWTGLAFNNTLTTSQLGYIDLEFAGGASGETIRATNSAVLMDHIVWGNTTRQILDFTDTSFTLTNSVTPDLTNLEPMHFSGLPAGGFAVIQGNTFGHTTGYNDVIDFTGGNRPSAIVQILDNVFLGSDDDILDLDGTDAHIEGNVFMSAHHGAGVPAADTSSAISGGQSGGQTSELTIVRNFFYDLDYALLLKEGNSGTLVNNTLFDLAIAAINFDEPGNGTTGPGLGAVLDGNIIWRAPLVFENTNLGGTTTQISISNTIVPQAISQSGPNVFVADPAFVQTTGITDPRTALQLRPGSPALGAGRNGVDLGADIPAGATIGGEPPAQTASTSATLSVGGIDLFGYKYRVNNGPWSAELPIAAPIQLSGLTNGQYTVYVVGQNSAGIWQPDAQATPSKTWTVNTGLVSLLISEVLASNTSALNNGGTFPDAVELFNAGAATINLTGMSLSDDPDSPAKYVFPAGTSLAPGARLVVYADSPSAAPGVHLDFSLDGSGEGVYLFNPGGATLVDSVVFGPQITDLSIGRVGHDRHWALNVPTLGAANAEQRTGAVDTLRLNEWFADGQVRFEEDFVEIYNPDPRPVALGGLYISDNADAEAGKYQIAPLSFVPALGTVKFVADDDVEAGGGHLPFRLADDTELLGLFDATLRPIDQVIYFSQTTDYSQGRNPDGISSFAFAALPTPGLNNPVQSGSTVTSLIATGSVWKYFDQGQDLGAAWRAPGYNDSAWQSGPAQLGYGDGDEAWVVSFGGDSGNKYTTTYFRRTFDIADPRSITALSLAVRRDDGVSVWLNGVEVARDNLPGTLGDNSITFSTPANAAAPDDGNTFLGFTVSPTRLVAGTNTIAVEIHQSDPTSSDISFDLGLDASVMTPPSPELLQQLNLLGGLRISEVMYNPAGGSDYEFVELVNVADDSLAIGGVRLSGGVDFTFPATNLAPGGRVVVVKNLAAFRSRYGSTPAVAGEFAESLSNGGEKIVLQLPIPYDAGILRFTYQDTWVPASDGGGSSLNIRDLALPAAAWDDRDSWEESFRSDGTPGRGQNDPPLLVLTISPLSTSDTTPPLSGTIANYPTATVRVTVGGQTYVATNHGGGTWSLADNVIAPLAPGVYDVVVSAVDGLGMTATDVTVGELAIQGGAATIVGRRVFYNNSKFDGNNPAASSADDGAVAPDKAALLPGQTASFANYTSFSKGINGLMIDVANLPTGAALAPADFQFRVGNDNTPSGWAAAPAPTSITLRPGAGQGGSTRATLIWADGAVKKQWLRVTVLATANTGLAAADVFYFGNAVGEAGNSTTNALVSAADELLARVNSRTPLNPAPIDFPYDYTRDGLVNAADQLIARVNQTTPLTSLRLIAPPSEAAGAGAALVDAALLAVEPALSDLARRRRWNQQR